ncbi:hypothetical protein Tco_1030321 [Tanacetum coccineum]|uniref:Uncharacterized protein n=1 Tax=Tanacetum coccineum TaxID=301880 RepID=A0ABQ5G6A7_9ASTR
MQVTTDLSTILILLGPTITNYSSLLIECRTTVNSSVLHSLSGLSMLQREGIGIGEYSLLITSLMSFASWILLFHTWCPSELRQAITTFSRMEEIISLLNASTPYRVYRIRRIVGKQIRRLDSKTQYAVLNRRVDTSYLTGGYGVSGDHS